MRRGSCRRSTSSLRYRISSGTVTSDVTRAVGSAAGPPVKVQPYFHGCCSPAKNNPAYFRLLGITAIYRAGWGRTIGDLAVLCSILYSWYVHVSCSRWFLSRRRSGRNPLPSSSLCLLQCRNTWNFLHLCFLYLWVWGGFMVELYYQSAKLPGDRSWYFYWEFPGKTR